MTSSITIYTGTCTVAVSGTTATITKGTDDTDGGFALLTEGGRIETAVGGGIVAANSGTDITVNCWSGTSSSAEVSWQGIPPLDSATVSSSMLDVLRSMNAINSLPAGRWLAAAAKTNFLAMDCLLNCNLTSMALTAPPDSPSDGDAYLVADSATDAWADYVGKIAYRIDGDWTYLSPFAGLTAYNAADGTWYRYDGSDWNAVACLGGALTTGGAVTFSGAYDAIINVPGAYTWTLPAVSGTLASLSADQSWSGAQTFGASANGFGSTGNTTTSLTMNCTYSGSASSGSGCYLNMTDQTSRVALGHLDPLVGGVSGYHDAALLSSAANIRLIASSSGNLIRFCIGGWNSAIVNVSEDALYPETSGATTLGTSAKLWEEVFASTTTISTSDSTKKTNVRVLSDAEIAAAQEMESNICILQYIAAVEAKGTDSARLHAGMIADTQVTFDAVSSVQAILKAHGLDPTRYAFWCRDAKTEEVETTSTVTLNKTYTVTTSETRTITKRIATVDDDGNYTISTVSEDVTEDVTRTYPVYDADGNAVTEDVTETTTITETVTDSDGNAEYVYSLRYTELVMFILAGMHAANSALTTRVAALETSVSALTTSTDSAAA